jgi:hypothetical protein
MGSVLDKLIELAGRKADVVCANDTEGLDEIVRAEEQAARDLAALEEERACVIAEEAESYAGEVEELRLALRGKAERLRVLNERNQRLETGAGTDRVRDETLHAPAFVQERG